MNSLQRPITKQERTELERLFSTSQGRKNRFGIMLAGFLVQWLGGLLAIVILWLIFSWALKYITYFDVGLKSPIGATTFKFMILLTAIWSAIQNWQWFSRVPNARASIAKDLTEGLVIEEHYLFSAAKCFREPEHGGCIYFLQDENKRAYVVYDDEGQENSINPGQASFSSLCPMTNLIVSRTIHSKLVLSQLFSGEIIQVETPREIAIEPEGWPDPDAFSTIKWKDLERKLCHQ